MGGVEKVVEVLKGDFLTVKGSAQTLKSFLLRLIGALAMYYPKEVEPKVVFIISIFIFVIIIVIIIIIFFLSFFFLFFFF